MASGLEGFPLINEGDIKLGHILGSGGFGDVFLATHKDWGDVAVKQMSLKRIEESKRGSVRRQQLKEAHKMWRAISSPYIVTVMGVIDEPDKAENISIVMEYFENGSLKDFQKKYMQCDCWARKVKMVQQIASGMNYLHTLSPPIIHRDLKLENVMVGDGLEVKIGDLGLAVSSATSIQGAGVAGTRSHIPPEASSTTEPDEAWDAFTFAVTSYELVSGKDAWPQQKQFANDALIAVWVMKGERPNLTVIPSDAPTELIQIITDSWVAEPKERPTFKVILTSLTDLFETKFKRGLRRADTAIYKQMDLVDESSEVGHQKSEESDSDFWGSSGTTVSRNSNTGTSVTSSDSGTSNTGPSVTSSDSGHVGASSDLRDKLSAMSVKERVADIDEKKSGKLDSGVGMSTASHHKSPAVWNLAQEIGREGDGEGEFRMARKVAIFDNSVMATVDNNYDKNLHRVYYVNKHGVYVSTLTSSTSNSKEKLLFPMDVAITSKQNLVVVDQSHLAKIFNIQGSYIQSISTLTPDEDSSTWVYGDMQVAVTCNDDIVIGSSHRCLLTVHSEADEWQPRQIKLDLKPIFLSTNMQGHILITCRKEKGPPDVVKVLTTSGQEVFTINSFRVDGKVGCPQGSVCDERGSVYIAVMVFDEEKNWVKVTTGHIHQYDHQGTFMKCVIQGIYCPYGLAISKTGSDMYVANEKSVLKYSAT